MVQSNLTQNVQDQFALMAGFTVVIVGTGYWAFQYPASWMLLAKFTGVRPVFIGVTLVVFSIAVLHVHQLSILADRAWRLASVAAAMFNKNSDAPISLGRYSCG